MHLLTNIRLLWIVVLLEAMVIAGLALSRYRIVLTPTMRNVTVVESPLEMALRYEASDAKFQELVQEDPEWMSYRSKISDMPILANCAAAKKTNYVRILIAHGADLEAAVTWLEKYQADEPLQLIREVESQLATKSKH
jgi:hypothetical protein